MGNLDNSTRKSGENKSCELPQDKTGLDGSCVIRSCFKHKFSEDIPSQELVKCMHRAGYRDNITKEYAEAVSYEYNANKEHTSTINELERKMMKNHAELLIQDSIGDSKCSLFKGLSKCLLKRFGLIHPAAIKGESSIETIRNRIAETALIQQRIIASSTIKKSQPVLLPIHPRNVTTRILPQIQSHNKISKLPQKKESPIASLPRLFTANPDHVKFIIYKKGKTYENITYLRNITKTNAYFKVLPLRRKSKFTVWWEKSRMDGPYMVEKGSSVPIHVCFKSDTHSYAEDILVVKATNGLDTHIFLQAQLPPPILKETTTMLCIKKFQQTASQYALSNNFECGKSLVGQCIKKVVRLCNEGAKGRFWIISEMDWLSATITKCNRNFVDMAPFLVSPAYFSLRPNEYQDITVEFTPLSFGFHTRHGYIISDNHTCRSIELLGDGIYFNRKFISFKLSDCSCDPIFFVFNRSKFPLDFYWRAEKEIDLSDQCLTITPKNGTFVPGRKKIFKIVCTIDRKIPGNFLIVMQLYIEKLPSLCVTTESKVLLVKSSKGGNDSYVDVLVGEVQVLAF